MIERILGIDTGTNSLGWAVVDKVPEGYNLIDRGVNIFQEGVKIEKGIEASKAAERTGFKALRVHYYRTKLRKIRLCAVLSDAGLLPSLNREELRQWRLKGVYPQNEAFREWQLTDDKQNVNPYRFRYICLTKKLDLSLLSNRYILGRAIYHINQRRGFLSNRKDQTESQESGKVKEEINGLSQQMRDAGFEYLGDYFYSLYEKGEKIRGHYTDRNEHHLKELRAICDKQGLSADLSRRIEKAIFYQRPLKSQKEQVGHCVFEKNKFRCSASHPLFEEFRMLSFVNNIKVKTYNKDSLRPLSQTERELAISMFYRQKERFRFSDIAKKIAGKESFGYYKADADKDKAYLFNYYMDTSVSGCPVTARLRKLFGDDWVAGLNEVYTLSQKPQTGEAKTPDEIVDDVWHALFFFSDEGKLREFGMSRLQLNEEEAKQFSKITVTSEYASLSLCALRKILPYLRRGMIYSHATFFANLGKVIPAYEWNVPEKREAIIDNLETWMNGYDRNTATAPLEIYFKEHLMELYDIDRTLLSNLYHPSMIDPYPQVRPDELGLYRLGSPRTNSIRNPMAMRAMFRLRKLVNRLLTEGKIDRNTKIHIEFARELNDANKRQAIDLYRKNNEKYREQCRKKICELYAQETGCHIEPTDTDILKFQLWEEQNHVCLYTGKRIGISDFLGSHPSFDIEHTIPRSVGGDSTRMNLTLCDSAFNRAEKKTLLPTQLSCHSDILDRIAGWKDKYERLEKQIRQKRTNGSMSKDVKDGIIRGWHLLELERDYWKGKYSRFLMTEVPEGFSRRQGTDISLISKYARLYLKSLFPKVYTVKGIATSDFRKLWGLQDIYVKKQRDNHVHHCIDAIVIACIGPDEYSKLAAYYHDEENHEWYGTNKAKFPKPWATFVEDIKALPDTLLVSHYTPDNMPKRVRRRVKMGKTTVISESDTARGRLHQATNYGAIQANDTVRYVIRRDLASFSSEKDIKSIVDDTVRQKVQEAVARSGMNALKTETIWMNEAKGVPIKKVRCFADSVKNPINIRQQRDLSDKEYKRQYHVMNDRNYLMAIYIGKDAKGKEKRDFKLVNCMQAADYFKRKHDERSLPLVPPVCEKGYPLAYTLKIGTMVLLYEKNPETEIWLGTKADLSPRLYKVSGFTSLKVLSANKYREYGRINLTFQQEARSSSEVKAQSDAYKNGEPFRPAILMLHTQIKALVEGVDFEINESGEIKRLR